MFRVAIFGCGGRIISLINNEISNELHSKFKIVAIYDTNFNQVMNQLDDTYMNFKKIIADSNTKIYTENDDTGEEKVYTENDFDVSIIASRNDKHYKSLILANKYDKHIFCEKPITHTIEQINSLLDAFKTRKDNLFFQTGLVLRYSQICHESKKYLSQIGQLIKVDGCELLNIGHGGQIIMKNWRRHKSTSGGLGLEKCVHDYDMIFHFIESVFGIAINYVRVQSVAENTFWIPSRKDEIMDKIESDPELYDSYHRWDNRTFQRVVDDPFEESTDLIPDQQHVLFMVGKDAKIPVNFEISTGSFRTKTERWYDFYGTKGHCHINMIDLEITLELYKEGTLEVTSSQMILLKNEASADSHAGGDYYVMQTLINLMSNSKIDEIVTFDEAIRSTIIGCLAEKSINEGEQIYQM